MSRNAIYGICKLCNKYKRLTFEHVPPQSTFNNHPVKLISGTDMLNNERLPWDTTGLNGPIQQKGKGGYFLCQDCNNKTGSWYIAEYTRFIHSIHNFLIDYEDEQYQIAELELKGFQPLSILKAVMTKESTGRFSLTHQRNHLIRQNLRFCHLPQPGKAKKTGRAF